MSSTYLGLNRKIVSIANKFMLFSMLHSSFVAPIHEMVIARHSSHNVLKYKASKPPKTVEPTMLPLYCCNFPFSSVSAPQEDVSFKPKGQKADTAVEYPATDTAEGIIGVSGEFPLDDPSDNLFKISLDTVPTDEDKAILSYELYGLSDMSGVSRSINSRLSTGGYIAKHTKGWVVQSEELDALWLRKGENKIMFAAPSGSGHSYKIKNVKISILRKKNDKALSKIILQSRTISLKKDNKIYIKGFVKTPSGGNLKVMAEGTSLDMAGNEFEGFLTLNATIKNKGFVSIRAYDERGMIGQEMLDLGTFTEADNTYKIENQAVAKLFEVKAIEATKHEVSGASIQISENCLTADMAISIMPLRKIDIAPLGSGMVNVTKGGKAFRFLPDGTKFGRPVKISIEYDTLLLPHGYGPKDVKTFYFDTNLKQWAVLNKDTVDVSTRMVSSWTTLFTDYINGIIQSPESPQTGAFLPNMMNDLKAADPSAEMTIISPPEASQRGDANINYPIKLPSGRKGMQPHLGIQYSSEGKNGWLGQGWSLQIPAITLDTRWGVPQLDTANESEIYAMNGEQLMYPKIRTSTGATDWMPNRHYDAGESEGVYSTIERPRILNASFTVRKQSGFAKIQRMGNSPSAYYWKVTDQSGTVNWYGGKNGVIENAVIRNGEGKIVHWGIFQTEDVHGNNIKYYYDNALYPTTTGINANLGGGKVFNIRKITYTNYGETEGMYEVLFSTQPSVRFDVSISARLGVKQIEPKFLSSIIVKKVNPDAANAYIRKYSFEIGYGHLSKGQLKSVAELAPGDVEFYKHTFDYYKDITDEKDYFSSPTTIQVPDFNANFTLGMGNILNASRINSSESNEFGWQARAAVGLQINWVNNNPGHLFTVGLPVGESYTKNKGKITMADMDGNGLDDIVYKSSSGLRYFPHFVNGSSQHYFDPTYKEIVNINDFSKTEGKTKTMFLESVDFRLKKLFIGTNRYKTEEKTSIYITDANGDMLPDIVKGNQVYFNNGGASSNTNTFTTSSEQTPNMLITGSPSLISPDDIEDPEGPQPDNDYDIVRVWEAPYASKGNITDSVYFSPHNNGSKVTYSIETSYPSINNGQPIRLFLKEFTASNSGGSISIPQGYDPTTPLGSNFFVNRNDIDFLQGQRFYFRLHKNKEARNELVITNPTFSIGGATANSPADQYGKPQRYYNYQDDFLLSGNADGSVPGTGTIAISWGQVQLGMLSDNITYKITREESDASGNLTTSSVFSQTFAAGTSPVLNAGSMNIQIPSIAADHHINYKFEVISRSNLRWQAVQWKPVFKYTPDSSAQNQGISGNHTIYIVPNYSVFQEFGNFNDFTLQAQSYPYSWQAPVAATAYWAGANTFVSSTSPVQLNSSDTGKFTLVAKRNGVYLGSIVVNINAGAITLTGAPINIYSGTVANPPVINFEFYADGIKNLTLFKKYTKAVSYNSQYTNGTGNVVVGTQSEFANYPVSNYGHFWRIQADANHNSNSHMGNMYRGWGQFAYNDALDTSTIPSDSYSKLINNSIIDNYAGNSNALSTMLGLDIAACSNASNPSACLEAQLNASIGLPSENTPIDDSNIDGIVGGIAGLDASLISGMFCFQPTRGYRDGSTNQEEAQRWIAVHEEQYSSKYGMKNGDFSESQLGNYFDNPDDQEDPELIPNQQTGMSGITKVQLSASRSNSSGWGNLILAKSKSAYSNSISDFVDLNGDSYPDLVVSDNIQTTTMTGGHRMPSGSGYGIDPVSASASDNKMITYSGSYPIAGRKAVAESSPEGAVSDSGNPSATMGLGLSTNLSGSTKAEESIFDINGDGLADRIIYNAQTGQYLYKLNLGKSFQNAAEERYYNFEPFQTKPSSGIQPSYSLGGNLDSGSFSFNLSAGYSSTKSDAVTTFQDINGDGLPDLIKTYENGASTMQFNLGNSFSSQAITLPFNMRANLQNSSASLSGGINYFFGFPIFTTIIITVFMKVGVGASGNANLTVPETQKEFRDFNGDGYADLIEKTGRSLRVSYSKLGRTDLLKSVKNPIGGEFVMDYEAKSPDFDNPTAKWVMSKLTVNDGYNKVNDGYDVYEKNFVYEEGYYDRREREFFGYGTLRTVDSENYRTAVSKFHNRSYFLAGLLKESYVTKGITDNLLFSKTENVYELKALDTSNMSLLTGPSLSLDFDTGGSEGRRSCAVLLSKTKNYFYELNQSPMMISEENFEYDLQGRVKKVSNLGNIADPLDDYTTEISYHSDPALIANHIVNLPKMMTVSQSGAITRKRITDVDSNNGNIISIRSYNTASDYSSTDMEYDIYGNLASINYPENDDHQRMSYQYSYDAAFNKYVAVITDAFGYSSSAIYNYNFDKIETTTDLAGNQLEYEYDIFGRNTKILAPKEHQAGKPYTIAFQYYPKFGDLPSNIGVSAVAFVPVAVTSHYDSQHDGNDIQTYSFIDGLARSIQVKKDIQINVGNSQDPIIQEAVSVSGKTAYDTYGRAIEQFHPYFEDKSSSLNYLLNEHLSDYSSQTAYDEMDRPYFMSDPDGNTSTVQYSIEEDLNSAVVFKTRSVTDQNGNQEVASEIYKNVRGKVISAMNEGPTGPLWTQFNYDGIGQLLSYTDADNIVTTYQYDMLGRKKQLEHPDNGMTRYFYDAASNMTKLQTAALSANNALDPSERYIHYVYDYNRVIKIEFPNTASGSNIANVEYEYGSSGNETGRLINQKDATGTQNFRYGNMGEIAAIVRTVVAPNLQLKKFSTYFLYDSWNKINRMTYPDGERVNYTYDLGGNLANMQGSVGNQDYDYISRIDYDHYEQRTYISYGNNTETFYEYSPGLRRLQHLQAVASNQASLFDNTYTFDKVGNVTGIDNQAPHSTANKIGGTYSHNYEYDRLNRLIKAEGTFVGGLKDDSYGTDKSSYKVSLTYNATHGIATKNQKHSKNGIDYAPNTYSNGYEYLAGTHKLKTLTDADTNLVEDFEYDLNGNNTYRHDSNGQEKYYFWDESNRLRASADENGMQHYIYDASGERVLKGSSGFEALYENGSPVNGSGLVFDAYKMYPSAFLVVDGDSQYSKHYFAGSERIVSRIGEQSPEIFDFQDGIEAKAFDAAALKQLQIDDLQAISEKAKMGKVTFKAPKAESSNAESEAMLVPQAGNIYFFHPDHLGTSTYLTDINGNPYQFFLNLPFGETMAEQHSLSEDYSNPYKFNGKELDAETGLYYYGARYYDPRLSVWLSVDPLAEKHPDISTYVYCANNPVLYVDPDGRDWVISQSVRPDGTTVMQISITGKLINQSSTVYTAEQMSDYSTRLSGAIKSSFESASGGQLVVNVTANISVASVDNPLAFTDHAFTIVDNGKLPDSQNPGGFRPSGVIGHASFGELGVYINENILSGTPATSGTNAGTGKTATNGPTLERTGPHELGHTGTLEHPTVGTMNGNLMHQTSQPNAGTNVTQNQIMELQGAYNRGELNHGRQFYNTTGNIGPRKPDGTF